MSKILDIEQSFQNWFLTVRENYSYVLCAPECAARYAFEAGVNAARNEAKECANLQVHNKQSAPCCNTKECQFWDCGICGIKANVCSIRE